MNNKQWVPAICGVVLGLSLYSSTVMADQSHKVRAGDTLWGISHKYKATVAEIKSWNHLDSNSIYIGQPLIVNKDSNESLPEKPAEATTESTYVVQYGDTLWGIALKNTVSVSRLKILNDLSNSTIFVGEKLYISESSTDHDMPPTPPKKEPAPSTSYVVQSGDTLWGIALKHGTEVSIIVNENHLTNHTIYVGQKLTINSKESTATEDGPEQSLSNISLVNEAKKHMGTPYLWAGASPSGFDCSGFLHYVFAEEGIQIPRTVASIYQHSRLKIVARADMEIGDVVFFETYKPGASHAGIYIGKNQFIHSGSTNGVGISSMSSTYWESRYIGSKRYELE